jgi:hypothetical protein
MLNNFINRKLKAKTKLNRKKKAKTEILDKPKRTVVIFDPNFCPFGIKDIISIFL